MSAAVFFARSRSGILHIMQGRGVFALCGRRFPRRRARGGGVLCAWCTKTWGGPVARGVRLLRVTLDAQEVSP